MRILVLAAHPDDEVLGAGGAIARWAAGGAEVYVSILGEGISSRYASRDDAPEAELRRLKETAEAAGALLGTRRTSVHGLPDNRLDQVPLLEIAKIIQGVVEEVAPVRVLTHHPGDLNVDHGLVCRATLIATRPMAGGVVREILSYEVASATEWSFATEREPFRPNYFVDIEETLETKLDAMRAYESEVRMFPHPRSPKALEARATYWGAVVGVQAAEPFQVLRWLV